MTNYPFEKDILDGLLDTVLFYLKSCGVVNYEVKEHRGYRVLFKEVQN